MISAMPNTPIDQRHEADAVEQIADVEGVARVAGVDVGADEAQQHAEEDHAERLEIEPRASTMANTRPSAISEK